MSLFAGIFIGFLLALPPGGIVLVGLNLAMTSGFRRAVPYAYGTLLVDMAYAALAVMGARAAGDAYAGLVREAPALVIGMQAAIATALFAYSVHLFVRRTPIVEKTPDGGFAVRNRAVRPSRRGPFLLGVGLNLSNIFSPTFLAALAILAAQAQAFGVLEGRPVDGILYAVGFGIGNTVYLQTGMKLVSKYTRRLENRHVMRIQKAAGAAFAAIGGILACQAVRTWVL